MRRKPGKAKPGSLREPKRMAAAESRSSDALAPCWLRAGSVLASCWLRAGFVLASCCGFSDSGLGCACAEQNPAASPFFRSGIRSKFKAPKTPPSHGLTGFAAIKAGAKKRCFQGEFQNLAAKDWRPEANGPCIPQKDRQRHESAQAAPGFATLFRNPISQPRPRLVLRRAPTNKSRTAPRRCCRAAAAAAAAAASWPERPHRNAAPKCCQAVARLAAFTWAFALFLRANSRPRKRLHRTVWRAWLLSKQERNPAMALRARAKSRQNTLQPGFGRF